ncbi:hypothetical protein EHZ86_23005, partial [Aeromonas australiensis]|uniref:hypothetical protein n=1 Tax=Aeromonas australiensis TaxID=1114880 RepID=UPI001F3092A4
QVILELICENQAGLPVYMQALSGNSNDTKAFAQTVRRHLSSLVIPPFLGAFKSRGHAAFARCCFGV